MDIIDISKKRYAVKSFNPDLKIKQETVKKMEDLLRLSPSSINIQPWHYVIAGTDEGKKKIAEAASGMYSYNKAKIINASHVVVFCSKTLLEDAYIDTLLDREEEDGRFKDKKARKGQHDVKFGFSNLHRKDLKDSQEWMKRQVYLSLGFFLLGTASLGLDVCPMEGFDSKILDKVLSLPEKGYQSLFIAAAGYRNDEDFNAGLPKSRLPEDSVIQRL